MWREHKPDHGTGVVVVGAARTPLGSLGGSLSSFSAPELGGIAIKAALERAGVPAHDVKTCIMGHVLTAGVGQSPARQAATAGGLGESVVCTSVNKVCSSGMKAVMIACMEIQLGLVDVAVAGGMESMSNCPYLVREARFGARLGDRTLVDGLVHDGLHDPILDCHMGMHAELCAETHCISREEQDDYTVQSYSRGVQARDSEVFADEIVPVETMKKKKSFFVKADDELARTPISTIRDKAPAFKRDPKDLGTVTSANASPLNDGAAALVLMSEELARERGIQPLARILGYGDAELAPEKFTIAPSRAIPNALHRSKISLDEVDLFELNEAFAVVCIANMQLLKLDAEKVNVHGGGLALGHPLGCSGARVLVTLMYAMRRRNDRIGLGSICNGGGGASALVLGMPVVWNSEGVDSTP